MLCLSTSIRHADPSVQRLLHAVEDAPTLTALLLAAWPLARLVALHLVEAVLAERAQRPTSWPPCPTCGRRMRRKGFVKREVTSLFGLVQWHRRVGRCPQGCEVGQVAPLDETLGVQPAQRTSGDLQALGCALAIFVPCATAAQLLSWYSGAVVSPRAVWNWVQAAGQRAMETMADHVHKLSTGEEPPAAALEAELATLPLVIGADGVMVPFRPHGGRPTGKTSWREIKVGVLARVGQHWTRTGKMVARLHQRRVVAVLGDIDALKPRLWLEALRQGISRAPHVVWLSDGSRGLWRLFDERFAVHATGILDFYHAVQNLWKGTAAWLDGRMTGARRWFGWARHRLRHGHAASVLADLAEAVEGESLSDTARETVTKVYAYLDRHRDHIDYETYKDLGLPIGSGLVESACKWLMQQRLKGGGMRWSETGFSHLLHLRLTWVNGSFEDLFQVQLRPSPNM